MNEKEFQSVNRRDFLKSGSVATMMTMMGGVPLLGEAADAPADGGGTSSASMKVGVIGLGAWGREIVNTLVHINAAAASEPLKFTRVEVAGICDNYHAAFRRAGKDAPEAKQFEDYRALLDDKEIQAVVIATPTYLHKEPVLAALKAGKHVYCEAPLAQTIDDAREIALAAKAAGQQVFQSGLQMRSDPERRFLWPFIRSGALGHVAMARAQWHKKTQWRAAAPTPEREQALNWRLHKETSLGLIGEVGIHSLDQISWFLDARPIAVTGFGSVVCWNGDDRDVPDTVQAVIEYPGGVNFVYDATLADSFDSEYEMLYGSDGAVMMRVTKDGSKAWMFKEVDSPLLGWEVYARKDSFGEETGIALAADASKSVAANKKSQDDSLTSTPLSFALVNFLLNAKKIDFEAADYKSAYGADDQQGLIEHLSKTQLWSAAGYLDGYRAVVMAVKANAAINSRKRIEFKPEWYELG